MTRILSLALLAMLASCVAPRRETPAAPRPPEPRPVVRSQPAASPALDWSLRPRDPGDWRYQSDPNASAALFEGPDARFTLRCDRLSRRVTIAGAGAGADRTTIRTSSTARTLSTGDLAANDPLLDAIAYTRGRFAVQRQGVPDLILPAYAEVSRVIDDCRG